MPSITDFLWDLLTDRQHSDIIEWTNRTDHHFRIIDTTAVCMKWAQLNKKETMSYDAFTRAIRHCYTAKTMKKGKERYCFVFIGRKDKPISHSIESILGLSPQEEVKSAKVSDRNNYQTDKACYSVQSSNPSTAFPIVQYSQLLSKI